MHPSQIRQWRAVHSGSFRTKIVHLEQTQTGREMLSGRVPGTRISVIPGRCWICRQIASAISWGTLTHIYISVSFGNQVCIFWIQNLGSFLRMIFNEISFDLGDGASEWFRVQNSCVLPSERRFANQGDVGRALMFSKRFHSFTHLHGITHDANVHVVHMRCACVLWQNLQDRSGQEVFATTETGLDGFW